MTREEAVWILRGELERYTRESIVHGKEEKALTLAIEALKEMSVEEYRQRLMEVFHNTDHDELLTYVVMPKEEEFKSLEYILQKQPFEPRPHGEWIYKDMKGQFCSVCDKQSVWKFNFCPNCGADMRKGGDEK